MTKRITIGLIFGLFAAAIVAQGPTPKPKPPAELQGYPPEEEEAIPPKPKRRVIVEEEGPPPVKVPKFAHYARMDDLARAAADAKNPALKALLAKYVIAFDRITATDGTVTRVCPVPLFRDAKFPLIFGVFPLNDQNEPRQAISIDHSRVRRIDHFEELLAIEAERLLAPPPTNRIPSDDAPPAERALVAEQLMSAAVLFFDTARDLSKRRGAGWDKVNAETVAELQKVRLRRLQLAAEQKDWVTVRSLGTRMANLYPGNVKLLEEVFAARLAEGVIAAQSDQLTDLERARELLVEFESRFPGSKNTAAEQVRAGLKAQTEKLFRRAQNAVKTEDKEATRLLRTLEAIDPNYPGLRDLQGQLKGGYAIITVGVQHLPTRMSPFTARSDADQMAVDLVFESLVEAIPDDVLGTRYRPGLAASFPTVSSGARDLHLQRPVDWAGLTGAYAYADSADVAGTIRLLKGDFHATWAAANADWLIDQPRVEDQASLRIAFSGNHPYPISLLNFKIVPTRWLNAKGWKADDPNFSLHPYGTGPYKALANAEGKVTSFIANPTYGRRPGRLGEPFIKEIRFIDASKKVNLPALFKTEELHILPDVPTTDLKKYDGADSGLRGRVQVVTATQNRRIYMLAINHRRPALRSVSLRRGLALAIDRESILTQVFRGGRSEFHKALAGPFPPESWAVPKQPAPPSLFNRDLASAKFAEHSRINGSTALRLLIPAGEPLARDAMEKVQKQIELLGANAEGKITIAIDTLPYDDFIKAVYGEASFDLAYVPFDYPDDWYPFGLAALLDPTAAETGGRNFGGYLDKQANITAEDQKLSVQLTEIRRHADFSGKLVPLTHSLQTRFNDAMPFVPLWQLDRHTILSSKLQISFDDSGAAGSPKLLPPSIFTQAGRWKLD